MQEVYRVIITPYHYDYWDIFTTDKKIFDTISLCGDTDDARELFGSDTWDELVESGLYIQPPYVLLNETRLYQRD